MPVIFGGIAQSVEQMAVNHQVVGSNPTATAKKVSEEGWVEVDYPS